MPIHRVNITLDANTLAALETIEHATGASRSEVIRRSVAAYVGAAPAPVSPIEPAPATPTSPAAKSRRKDRANPNPRQDSQVVPKYYRQFGNTPAEVRAELERRSNHSQTKPRRARAPKEA